MDKIGALGLGLGMLVGFIVLWVLNIVYKEEGVKETVYKKRVLELTSADVMNALSEYYGLELRNLNVELAEDYKADYDRLNPNNVNTWLTVTSEEGTL